MTQRETRELLVLLVAVTVGVLLIVCTVGVVLVELIAPETDTTAAAQWLAHVVGILVGVIAGYAAGKGRSRDDV